MADDGLNVLIGDEDMAAAERVKDLCLSVEGMNVLGLAHSSQMLIAKIRNSRPDLLLLSSGAEIGDLGSLIDSIRKIDPDMNIVLMYNPDRTSSDELVESLEMGVYECIKKPMQKDSLLYQECRLRLLTITGLMISRKRFSKRQPATYKNKFFMPSPPVESRTQIKIPKGRIEAVVMASSTGGPEILSRIFSILPGKLSVPILLVQHIPAEMTRYFAKSLNQKSELTICQAAHGEPILPSRVYIAPGGQHMTVSKADAAGRRRIELNSKMAVNSVRPSADVLFESVAASYRGNILAVVLTGMGEDGKNGVAALKKNRCVCLTQKAETCVVYGMPRAVDEAGLSDESLDPLSITQKIVEMVQ